MDKNAIFNEFKKIKENKVIEAEVNNDIVEEVKEVKMDEQQIINVQDAAKKRIRNKNKRNRKNNNFKNKETVKTEVVDNFESWKEKFLSDETNKDFMELLKYYREHNFNIFSDEEFFRNKYNHPQMRTVILDPTVLEENAGKGGNAYLVKPLYTNEYNYFLKNIGTREEKPEDFMKYAVKTGVLYPKFNDETLDKTGAGTILALYNYILQFSDLTKTIKVLEV